MRKKKDSIYKNNVNRDYSCIICGWNKRDAKGNHLTEGAHVREHKSGDEFDIETNMIDLCPNHHTEYDSHNFYIDVETKNFILLIHLMNMKVWIYLKKYHMLINAFWHTEKQFMMNIMKIFSMTMVIGNHNTLNAYIFYGMCTIVFA